MQNTPNLINRLLCGLNPKMHITPTHYVCGSNLAFFASLAQVENCLTGFTNKCKTLTSKLPSTSHKNDIKS